MASLGHGPAPPLSLAPDQELHYFFAALSLFQFTSSESLPRIDHG